MEERGYDRAVPYLKEETDFRLKRKDERSEKPEMDRPYLIRDRITVLAAEMIRAVDASMRRSSVASSTSRLMKFVEKSTIKICLEILLDGIAEYSESVPDTKAQLTFVKHGYMVDGIFRR